MKSQKKLVFSTTILLLMAVLLSLVAFAVDPNGRWFGGSVYIDGTACPNGILVKGSISGVNHINATVGSGAPSGNYSMLYPEYNNPPGTLGGQNGNTVIFNIGSLQSNVTALFNTSIATMITVPLYFTDNETPSAPTSPSAAETSTAGELNITWTAATDNIEVKKYLIYRDTSTGLTSSTGTNVGNSTSTYYEDVTGTTDGETYYYVVVAMDTSNTGDDSSETSATVTDNTPPAEPTGLTVTDVSGAEGTLNISWSANSESDLFNYILYVSTDNASFAFETSTTALYYLDTSLTDTTQYFYRLRANDTSGNPSANATINGTPTDSLAPNAATGVSVTDEAGVENQVNISWTASGSGDAQGYMVYRNGTFVVQINGSGNISYVDTNVVDGLYYLYEVSTYDEIPNYAANASGTGTPVDDLAPKQAVLQSAVASNTTVVLSWNNVTTNSDESSILDLAGFHVYRNSTTEAFALVATTTELSHTNSTLTNDVTYYFKVAAFDDAGNEGLNSTLLSATPAERPTVTATPATGSIIKSTVLINITATSGPDLFKTNYTVYNSTSDVISSSGNATAGTTHRFTIDPAAWKEFDAHLVYVHSNDTNGQITQENFTYTVDDTKPEVGTPVFGDADRKVRSTDNVRINVTVIDNTTISSVTLWNESSVAMANAGGNLYTVVTNASALGCTAIGGRCTVKVTAVDAAGNINDSIPQSVTLDFTIDDIAPNIAGALAEDADNKVRSTDNFDVNVTVVDNINVSSVTVGNATSLAMSNITATLYNVTINASAMGCSEGSCILTFTATDVVGNTNTTTLTITVDDTAPTISSVTISDDYVQNNTAVVVTVVTNDTNSVVSVVAEGVSLADQTGGIWNGTIYLKNVTDEFAVNVTSTDVVGNAQTHSTTTYTIDDEAPAINSVSLSDRYVKNNTAVTVTVNVTDNSIYSVTAEGTALTRSGDIWSGSINLINGSSPLNITATDNASNIAKDGSVTYTIDDVDPVIDFVTLADKYVSSSQIVLVTVNVTDGNTSTVTANSVSLVNSAGKTWIGNITMPSSSGNVTVLAIDEAGNNATDTAADYIVDDVAPTFSITIPVASAEYVNANGTIEFNFVVIEDNVSIFNVSIDNGLYKYGGVANGTILYNFTGLKAGTHTAVFTATDEADNAATAVSRTFKVVRPLNMTQIVLALNGTLGQNIKALRVKQNTTDISTNETANVNATLKLEMEFNVSTVIYEANIPSFDGLSANWEYTFGSETNITSSKAAIAASRAGAAISKILLFENATNFLSTSNFGMAVITVKSALVTGKFPAFIADDSGSSIYKLSECSSVPTSVASNTDACYMNTSANVTYYLPHFSGIAELNDTTAPTINITTPVNDTTLADSYLTLSFTAYELNPATTTFCNYTLNNGSDDVYYDLDIDVADMSNSGDTAYTFSQAAYNLKNGSYTMKVICMDLNNQSSTLEHEFTVADTTAPTVSSKGPSGAQSSSTTSLTATLSATTDERTLCKYGATNTTFALMSSYLGSSSTYGLTHTASISYSADDSSEAYYVACVDVNGNEVTAYISYSVDITEATTSSSTGDSGIVPPAPTFVTYSQTWLSIAEGEIKSVTIDKDGMPFTSLDFTATKELKEPDLSVKVLHEAPSDLAVFAEKAYKYILITETNIVEGDVKDTSIGFKVAKSWFAEQGVEKGKIALFRYVNNAWVAQDTVLVSEDADFVHYKAMTTGLSNFLIGVKLVSEEPIIEPEVEPETEPEVGPETEPDEPEITPDTPVEPKEGPGFGGWMMIFGILLAVGGFAFGAYEIMIHRHNQEKEKESSSLFEKLFKGTKTEEKEEPEEQPKKAKKK